MNTKDLEAKIRKTKRLDMNIVSSNPPPLLYQYISEILKEKCIKRSKLIHALNIDRNYGYQILNGTRIPTRIQVVKIGLYLGMTVEQVQKMLTLADRSVLYVRRPEDAKIVHCLERKIPYAESCEFIWGDRF